MKNVKNNIVNRFVIFLSVLISLAPTYAHASTQLTTKNEVYCNMGQTYWAKQVTADLATPNSQKVWILVNSSASSTINVSLYNSPCVAANVVNTNGKWQWVEVPALAKNNGSGKHTITVGSPSSKVNWSYLYIYDGTKTCTPNGLSLNCVGTKPDATRILYGNPPTVTTTTTTKLPTTTTTKIPATTTTTKTQNNVVLTSTLYTGNLVLPTSAPWALHLTSNGGTRMTIDGKVQFDDLENRTINKRNTAYYTFQTNRTYKIIVEYKNTIESNIKFTWSRDGMAETMLPNGVITPGVGTTTTKAPVTTTTKAPVTSTTKVSTPINSCDFNQSVGIVQHPLTLSYSGKQKIWVRIKQSSPSQLQLSFGASSCITENLNSVGNGFIWVPISSASPLLNAGTQNIYVGSSLRGFRMSNILIIDERINCTPIADGSNCSSLIYVQPTQPTTSTTISTTTTTHNMGGNSADNQAVAKYRASNPLWNRFANTRSDQLPLTSLLQEERGDPQWYGPNSPTAAGANGQVRTRCEFSHLSYDDPIMKPNLPGGTHLHMFFGNTNTDAYSTADSILNSGGSTCDGFEANRTAYWFPAMLDANGNARIPNNMMLYYKAEGMNQPAGGYTEIPSGLKMIAGSPGAQTAQVAHEGHGFTCSNMFTNPNSVQQVALIPNCNSGLLSMKVMFPRCWDGSMEFDPSNPFKHVTYGSQGSGSAGGVCPATHPKVFVGLSALFEWQTGGSTAGWHLSSDMGKPGGTTIHGDWFGGWNKDVLRNWNANCINAQWNCQTSLLGANNSGLNGISNGRFNMLAPTSQAFIGKGPISYTIPPRT